MQIDFWSKPVTNSSLTITFSSQKCIDEILVSLSAFDRFLNTKKLEFTEKRLRISVNIETARFETKRLIANTQIYSEGKAYKEVLVYIKWRLTITMWYDGLPEHFHVALDVPLLWWQRWRMLTAIQTRPGPLLQLKCGRYTTLKLWITNIDENFSIF